MDRTRQPRQLEGKSVGETQCIMQKSRCIIDVSDRSRFGVLLCKVLRILHELGLVLHELLGELGAERMVGFGFVDELQQRGDHCI